MRNLKSFKKFNEELDPSTYLSAADKLDRMGFSKRAKGLKEFGVDKRNKMIDPITIEAGDQTYNITHENIIHIDQDEVLIVTDYNLHKALESSNSEDLIPYFDKYKDLFNKTNKKVFSKFDNLSPDDLEAFKEFLEFEIQGFITVSDGEYSGLVLNSRRDASKLWKFIKQAGKGRDYEYYLTVNDIPYKE